MSKRMCEKQNKNGEPCGAPAGPGGLCSLHASPSRAAELGRKGGRGNRHVLLDTPAEVLQPPRNAEQVKAALSQVMADVHGHRLDTKVASCIVYAATVLLKAIEVADLEARIQRLEEASQCLPKG